jgi:hypothetical protein
MAWQTIFELSKVNGGTYADEALPYTAWSWPKETWLQQKRRELRELQKEENPWPIKHRTDDSTLN